MGEDKELAELMEKNSGRVQDLKEKLDKVIVRYKSIFNKALTRKDLEEFMTYCERVEKESFLESKIGRLNSNDRKYLGVILDERFKQREKSTSNSKGAAKSKRESGANDSNASGAGGKGANALAS